MSYDFKKKAYEHFRALATYCFPEDTDNFHCFQEDMSEFILLYLDRQCELIFQHFLMPAYFPHDSKRVTCAELPWTR